MTREWLLCTNFTCLPEKKIVRKISVNSIRISVRIPEPVIQKNISKTFIIFRINRLKFIVYTQPDNNNYKGK